MSGNGLHFLGGVGFFSSYNIIFSPTFRETTFDDEMIGLVDGNNFDVSCERVFDPSLEGKSVAVMSNNDGCCISRSYEFKALNIPMGTPFFQLKPLIPKHGLILKSSNYELYGDLSRRVIATLSTFTPAWRSIPSTRHLSTSRCQPGATFEFGRKVRQTVLQWVGIPCGVGFARSKTIAKIANLWLWN